MNLLFFHRQNDFTGSTRALASIIEEEFSGNLVTVVTMENNGGGFLSKIDDVKLIIIYSPTFLGKKIKFFSYIISQIHLFFISIFIGYKFNTFYVNTIVPYPAVIGGWILQKKIIYHIHEKIIDKSLDRLILEWVFNNVKSEKIFVSKYVSNQYPLSSNKQIIKYTKLPSSFLNKVKIRHVKDRLLKNIIMISSLSEAKGVKNFIELAKLLPMYKFTLIVSAPQNKINLFFGEPELYNLEIIPTQSNIHPFLYNSDLLLNLSIPSLCIETFGLTILEAMSYGIPSIVPNIGGPIELIENGYNGYCVDVENLKILVYKIEFVLDNKNYDFFSNNALKRLEYFV